jgi:hypothetical protein
MFMDDLKLVERRKVTEPGLGKLDRNLEICSKGSLEIGEDESKGVVGEIPKNQKIKENP